MRLSPPFRRLLIRSIVTIGVSCGLVACAGSSFQDIAKSINHWIPQGKAKPSSSALAALDRRFDYIYAQTPFGVSIWASPRQENSQSSSRIWHGSRGELTKIQFGRIISIQGISPRQLEVSLPTELPWDLSGSAPQGYWRLRDDTAGYRLGQREWVEVTIEEKPSAAVGSKLDSSITQLDNLRWIKERYKGSQALADSWIGLRKTQTGRLEPTAGQQCLSEEICVTWQKIELDSK